jgi:PIN domain nuclease of toxin-antitoxin system
LNEDSDSSAWRIVDKDEALTLAAASVFSTPALALELERLQLSHPDESLRDAQDLRRRIVHELERLHMQPEGDGS